MAVSLVSTGVQFPDSTIQTTAAAAGGTTTGTASGSIGTGAPVIVNSDGTFSTVTGSGAVNGTPSSPATYYASKYTYVSASDPSTGVSAMWAGESTNTQVYALTVSGTTITWGSPVSPTGNNAIGTEGAALVAMGSNKFMGAYRNSSDGYSYVVVFTVSGTTITMGTAVKISPSSQNSAGVSLAYNAATGSCVVGYRHATSPYYTYIAVVTVSGTVPTIGTGTQVSTEQIPAPAMVYDSNIQRIIAYWGTNPGNQFLNGAVLTISGSTVSIGTITQLMLPGGYGPTPGVPAFNPVSGFSFFTFTQYQFGPGGTVYYAITSTQTTSTVTFGTALSLASPLSTYWTYTALGCGYCSAGGTTYIVGPASYSYGYYLQYAAITVTNGVISVASPAIVNSTYAVNSGFSMSSFGWDSVSNKFVRQTIGALGVGYVSGIAFNPPYTNATSNNFLGLSTASYTNGQTATITVVGGINTGSSGLSPGKKYYLNYDGTLSATPNNPANIYAGLATASAKILVKG